MSRMSNPALTAAAAVALTLLCTAGPARAQCGGGQQGGRGGQSGMRMSGGMQQGGMMQSGLRLSGGMQSGGMSQSGMLQWALLQQQHATLLTLQQRQAA